MMFVVPLLLVALVVLLVVSSSHGAPERRPGAHAQEILDQRLAAGEVSSEEHARRSATLAERRVDSPGRPAALIIGTVAVVGLFVAAIAWGGGMGGGMGWGMGWGSPEHDRLMSGHMGWTSTAGSADAPVPGAATVELVATDLRFDLTSVTVTAGVPVNLTLVNDGRALHDLTIPALDFSLVAEPGEQASGSLVVDDPGAYAYECSVPGHAAAGMRGTLVVDEVPS